MKSPSKSVLGWCAVFVCATGLSGALQAAEPLPAALRQLAAASAKPSAWPGLRRYASRARDPELQGLARFVLGYREFVSGDAAAAARDLEDCPTTGFSLADYAAYYLAAAALKAGDSLQAAQALADFSTRFPESPLRARALELRAEALLAAQRPAEAVQALTAAESRVRQRPELALLLAQSYDQAQQNLDAARAFQEVHNAFPATPQAKVAAEALDRLRLILGGEFPLPTEEIQTARADLLFKAGEFEKALNEYKALISVSPNSALTDRWRLGRARCLLRLRRASDAVQALTPTMAIATSDAERLALLIQAHDRENDATGVAQALAQLQSLYAQSPSYADALFAAGNFYLNQADWTNAAQCYKTLLEAFPQIGNAQTANWRIAWAYYQGKDLDRARQAFRDYMTRYPDSPQSPAALYWLGRTAEAQSRTEDARGFYALVRKRFVHSYYALQAAQRARALPSRPSSEGQAAEDAADSPVAALTVKIPPPQLPQASLCAADPPAKMVEPAATLRALSLPDLALDYLRTTLAERPASSDLRLSLSRLEAAQGNTNRALLAMVRAVPQYPEVDFATLPREIWGLLYPRPYWALVQRYARLNRLDPYLVMGLIRQESGFDSRATSSADARGLMQLLPKTASHSSRPARVRAAGRRLYNPVYNVRLGCAYLRDMLKEFDG
ncbi:MAG: tetratricopeptide repeat protein [Acidobacteriia bacterium]|nr:tetratricopeptide repeat protein [Terriglobia bacterium]